MHGGEGRALRHARGALALALALALAAPTPAQRLPVQTFGLREGLANPHVTCLLEDRKGYLWIGTWEGLSRCDGRRFVNYGPGDGLPTGIVNALREDRQGRVWVATNGGGIARLQDRQDGDDQKNRFVVHEVADLREANVVEDLLITDDGTLFCVTEAGIYRGSARPDGGYAFAAIYPDPTRSLSGQLFRGGDGSVWVALADAVGRIGPGGLERTAWPSRATKPPTALYEEADGSCLVAFDTVLYRVGTGRPGAAPVVERAGPATDASIRAIARGARGELLLGTDRGLVTRDASGAATTTTRKNGLPDELISSALLTTDHCLWLGTDHGGVARIAPAPITSYTCASTAEAPNLHRVVIGRDGRVYAASVTDGIFVVEGGEFVRLPGSEVAPFANVDMRLFCDPRGDFWIGTDAGIHHAPGPRLDFRTARRLGAAEGVPEAKVFGEICASTDGRIWYGTGDEELVGIDASEPAHLRVVRKVLPEGATTRHPRALLGAPDGGLWIAPFVGLWRLRGDTFTAIASGPGLPGPYLYPRSLFLDRRGRLWVGTRFAGVSMSESPDAGAQAFRQWSTRDGLSSDAVWSIDEDEAGTIYLGTGRGLDALDPATGTIRHVGADEGLAGSVAFHLARDARGRIWVGANGGLSCLDPKQSVPPPPPPRVYVTRLVAGGNEVRLPETGASELDGLVLPPDHTDLWLEATVVSGEVTRFQHRLLGNDAEWSASSDQAMVRFPQLAPGSYRLLVRARLGDGRASEHPASVAFVVLAPIWARWWFVLGSACVLAAVAFSLHRARLARALALERLRTEIATDLHDDLGSGLAQIAIQSEVGRRGAGAEQEHTFSEIARLARGLRESIADIVWAVDPSRDRLLELVRRARHVVINLLESDGLDVAFTAPEDERTLGVELPAHLRRHLLLFVKEAVTNVARHAKARSVTIEITFPGDELGVRIRDDGCGFDTARVSSGHGLTSLARRAHALGAELTLRSEPGAGTEIRLRVPLSGRNRIDMRLPEKPVGG